VKNFTTGNFGMQIFDDEATHETVTITEPSTTVTA
jgi:hypothetical protein